MGKRKQRKFQEPKDPMDKEIKYFVTIVLIAFTLVSFMPLLGQQAQPLRFLDGIIQYADAAEFYIDPDVLTFAHHVGTGTVCPVATGPASADSGTPPSANEFFLDRDGDADGCYYPIYIWDEGSLLPRIFDQYIDDAERMYFKTEWGSTDWNSADNIGGGVGCTGLGVENFADPRINVTDTYEAIRSNAATTATAIGGCDSDLNEDTSIEIHRSLTLDEAYINRVNDTYFAIGGRLGASGGVVRDTGDRGVDLELSKVALKAAFQIPADYSNNWWQLQEHPMFINELGTPTGDQFSDNSPAIIDSGFFGIDINPFVFTFDTGIDDVERGQVALFKQFNKNDLLGGVGWNITSASLLQNTTSSTGNPTSAATIEDVTFSIDGLHMYLTDTQPDDEIDQYDLSTAWDISTAVNVTEFDVSSENISPEGLDFSPDGKKMVMLGGASDAVFLYELSTPWDVSTASYTGKTGDVSAEELAQNGLAMKPDGMKMYVSGTLNDRIYEYDLATAWDVSTATFLQSELVAANSNNPEDVEFRDDGLVMVIQSDTGDEVDKYILSTAWDVTTATYDSTLDINDDCPTCSSTFAMAMKPDGLKMYVSARSPVNAILEYDILAEGAYDVTTATAFKTEDLSAEGSLLGRLFISPDGTKLFTAEEDGEDINQYSLSTAWDISTSTFVTNQSASNSFNFIKDVHFSPNGTKIVVLTDEGSDTIQQFDLSTPFDLTTISILQSVSTITEDAATAGLWIRDDGLKMYVTGLVGDEVNEYDLTEAFNVSTKSFVQVLDLGASDEPQDIFFTPDGFTMFVVSTNPAFDIETWDLSTAWDISTAVHGDDFTTTEIPLGLFFKSDGRKMFISATDDQIHSYHLAGGLPDFRVQGGIQSVTALGDTKIRVEVRDHALQAGQTQFFGAGLETSLDGDDHDGQDYFHKNRPIKYINNGSLGVIDFEPTSLGAIEPFDISIKPEWTHSTSDIITLIVSLQDNSTAGALIGNITSIEVEDVILYDFTDINELLFFEDDCNSSFANVHPVGNSGEGITQNDENCGADLGNGLVNINNNALSGAISGTLPTPAAVTGLSVGVITDDSLILNWSHDLIDTTGFKIDRDDGSGLVEYISNTAVGGPNGEGGSIETRFIDINYNVTAYPSRANALGLDDNTQYSYRVCALNGDIVGTCSSTVAQTTPDYLPFWEIVEHSQGIAGAGILMTHTGGDGDWIEMESGLTQQGGYDGFMFKTFDISKLELLERNSIPIWYYDIQEANNPNMAVAFCDGELNRFNTTFFEGGVSADNRCTGIFQEGFIWKDNFATGLAGAFEPILQSNALNINSTYFPTGNITVVFQIRDVSAVDNKGFQIKNFTWTNSTTWEFESGNGASMNWTARINVDEENGESGSHYTTPLYANCEWEGNTEKYIDHTYDCDEGTIKAASASHQIIQNVLGEHDWEYAETNGIIATGLGHGSISSNGSGLVVDHSKSVATNAPDHFGKFFIFKEFPSSVLQEGNVTVTVRAENSFSTGTNFNVAIFNKTITDASQGISPVEWDASRWNNEIWGENGYVAAGGPSFTQYIQEILGDSVNKGTMGGLPMAAELTARDGDAFAPWDTITVTKDFSSFTNFSDNIIIELGVVDNNGSGDGTTMIQNLTVGRITYNFTNSNIQNELGENQFLRVTKTDPNDYQFFTASGADRGTITAGSIIVAPPPVPSRIKAVADNDAVLLSWFNGIEGFSENFATDTWNATGNALEVLINTTSQELDFHSQVTSTSLEEEHYDLKAVSLETVPDTDNFNLRFKLDIDEITGITGVTPQDSSMFMGLGDCGQHLGCFGSSPSQDFLGLRVSISSTNVTSYDAILANGVALTGGVSLNTFTTPLTDNDLYYVEIIRTSLTSGSVSLYSDSGFTNLVETKSFTGLDATVDDLRFIKFVNINVGTVFSTGGIEGIVDDVSLAVENPEGLVDSYKIERKLGAASYFDDFTTNNGWVTNNTAAVDIFTGTGTINVTDIATGTSGGSAPFYSSKITLDLEAAMGEAWNQDTWTLRGKLDFNKTVGGAGYYTLLGVSEVDQEGLSGTRQKADCAFEAVDLDDFERGCLHFLGTSGHWRMGMKNETDNTNGFSNINLNVTSFIQGELNTFYYPELIVDNNQIRMTVYSDPAYLDVLGCNLADGTQAGKTACLADEDKGAMEIQSTFSTPAWNDLQYLWYGQADANIGGGEGRTQGSHHYVAFYNGVNATEAGIEEVVEAGWSTIVESTLLEPNEFLSDDFSSYPTNATADLTWVKTISGTDSADDVVGVNVTDDKIYFWTNSATGSNILFDLNALLGQNLTDANGNGDFNMTWTSDLSEIDGQCAGLCVTSALFVTLQDRDASFQQTQTGITTGYFYQGLNPSFEDDAAIYVQEDSNPVFTISDQDCENQGPNPDAITLFHTLSKTGQDLVYNVGTNDDYGGIPCGPLIHTTAKTLDDIRFLKIHRTASGSQNTDYGFSFDDFAISINGTLLNFYYDRDVERGTQYTYRVSALNIDDVTESEPSDEATVLTNDIPDVVVNTEANFDTPTKIDVQWDELAFNSGEGLESSGLELTKYQIYRQNLTSGNPFELAGEVFASSPPPNFFNDTSVAFPSVFTYQISACNGLGCSANSTSSSALVVDPPSAVFDTPVFNATAVDNTVSLDWNDSIFAINYTVLRSESQPSVLLLDDDFSGTDDWIDAHASSGVNIATDEMDITFSTASQNEAVVFDLGTVNPSNWVLRLKMNFDTLTDANNGVFFVGLSNNTSGSDIEQDSVYMGVVHATGNKGYDIRDSHNTNLFVGSDDTDFSDPFVTSTDYYLELKRVGATYSGQVFTDSSFIIPFGNELAGTISPEIDDLRYVFIKNFVGANQGFLEGIIDDVKFYNSTISSFNIIAQGVPNSDYIDTTINQNMNYTFAAYGVNDNGNGTTGFSNSVLTNDVPTEPLNFSVEMGMMPPYLETPILNWTIPVDQGDGTPTTSVPIINYTVERKAGIGAFSFLKAELNTNQNGTTDDTAVVAANYTWKVQACNIVGCSPFSNIFSIIVTPITVPPAPINLTATTISGSEIFLDWTAPITNASNQPSEYRVQQRHVGFTGFVTIADTGNLFTNYNATGLVSGGTYDYRVAGISGAGQGDWSNIAQNVTFTVPTAPLNLIANTINKTAIFLDWDEPTVTNGGIVKYEIEQESPIGNGFSKIAEVAATTNFTSGLGLQFELKTSNIAQGTCPYPNGLATTGTPITHDGEIRVSPSNSALWCERNAIEWDISIIPVGAIITNVTMQYDIDLVALSTTPRPCSVYSLEHQPSVNTELNGWDDAGNGTLYFSDNTCNTQAVGYQFSSQDMIDDLQANVDAGEGWWGVGEKFTSEFRSSSNVYRSEFENHIIFVDYINATVAADTEYTVTGLTTKTEYNYRVNATNLVGSSVYSNEAANTTYGVPDAPINELGDTNGINEITVSWDEGVNNFGSEVTGYRIDQALQGGTWVTAINDTGNNIEPLEETFAGLLPQTTYSYRIFAYNSFGISLPTANLTQGTFTGPTEPENFFAVFNATKPYSVNLSWAAPLNDGGRPIIAYLIERQNEASVFVQIANVTNSTFAYTDTNLLNLATHVYRIAAQTNPVGSFTPDQPVVTFVPANIVGFTIDEFGVVGDVLQQNYSFVVDDCFPTCVLSQADIERNGIVESNIPLSEPVPLDTPIEFTTWFILPTAATSSINTTAFVTNLGGSGDDEAGVTLATAEFLVPTSLFFNHTRTPDFEDIEFQLVRHPVPWEVLCEHTIASGLSPSIFGISGVQPVIEASGVGVGYLNETINANPQANSYIACFDPSETLNKVQILSFTSFGLGNGTFALISFTSQLGEFLGVPVAFVFIIFLAAIWTGRSASTGVIFLAVAIGFMGVLGYFPDVSGDPLLTGGFWSLIVLMTALGVFMGKRFF